MHVWQTHSFLKYVYPFNYWKTINASLFQTLLQILTVYRQINTVCINYCFQDNLMIPSGKIKLQNLYIHKMRSPPPWSSDFSSELIYLWIIEYSLISIFLKYSGSSVLCRITLLFFQQRSTVLICFSWHQLIRCIWYLDVIFLSPLSVFISNFYLIIRSFFCMCVIVEKNL